MHIVGSIVWGSMFTVAQGVLYSLSSFQAIKPQAS